MFFLLKLKHAFAHVPPPIVNVATELFKAPIDAGTPSFIIRSYFGCHHADHIPSVDRAHDHLIKNMVMSCGRLKYHLPLL